MSEEPEVLSPVARRFSERFRALLDNAADPITGRPLTVDGLYKTLNANEDFPYSRGHLYRLYKAETIPRLDSIEMLARYFGVPESYFVAERPYDEEIAVRIDEALNRCDAVRESLLSLKSMLNQGSRP
ncbi:hypothetical protein [Mycobacteroides abscessus]|uniref:HTH cro/C1-type domain-containing protein n=1 Tax=Mycobacteroides abscessus TaxID=36809 RepID=A0A0U0ZT59_9MYCO|nr:hypothetical protein [Mycobacteroides abscessus]CPV66937.1 Uncharacterised protein [Mycobacteroides abscessus]